jgi:putative transposase
MFNVFTRFSSFVRNLGTIVSDGLSFLAGVWRRRTALAAENLFLRKQLALFREREKKAMPTTPADRFVFSKLARWFDWRNALMIVKPATLIGWHRKAFRLFWRWKSRPVGRPRVTAEVRQLIRRLAAENPTWGEQRIADELLLKLQIRLSPRTVAKYRKQLHRPHGSRDQHWSTFLKSHANAIAACDFIHRCDGLLSRGLRVRGAGDRFATADSFQCNRTSDGGVDFATAAGSAARRSGIQVAAS